MFNRPISELLGTIRQHPAGKAVLRITGIILLLGGLLIFSIGIVGEYLAKMYLEIKDRPVYIVKEEE